MKRVLVLRMCWVSSMFSISLFLMSPAFCQDEPKAEASEPISKQASVGIVDQQPQSGQFVKTESGYMVPYKATIPGSKIEFEMIPIPGGKVLLGSAADDEMANEDE